MKSEFSGTVEEAFAKFKELSLSLARFRCSLDPEHLGEVANPQVLYKKFKFFRRYVAIHGKKHKAPSK